MYSPFTKGTPRSLTIKTDALSRQEAVTCYKGYKKEANYIPLLGMYGYALRIYIRGAIDTPHAGGLRGAAGNLLGDFSPNCSRKQLDGIIAERLRERLIFFSREFSDAQ